MKQAALLSRALRFSSFSSFSPLSPVSAACLVLAALTALPTLAQQNEAQAREARARGAKGDEAPTLPAVTVQARQVREKVQELPFTVNVLDEAQLEERRLTSLEDVLRGTPGVEVNSWGDAGSANMRLTFVSTSISTFISPSMILRMAALSSDRGLSTQYERFDFVYLS